MLYVVQILVDVSSSVEQIGGKVEWLPFPLGNFGLHGKVKFFVNSKDVSAESNFAPIRYGQQGGLAELGRVGGAVEAAQAGFKGSDAKYNIII